MTHDLLEDALLAQALENTKPGTHMAGGCVDPDGTARIELLERLAVGWWNFTTKQRLTSGEMARKYDDVVVTRLPPEVAP